MKTEILKIKDYFKELTFEEKEHRYFVDFKPIKISVSGIIHNYVEPFNSRDISAAIAKRDNVSQESVLADWKKTADDACKLGTDVHLFGENYTFDRTLKPKNLFEESIVNLWKSVPSIIMPVLSELKMYHKQYMFAGTMDLLLYNIATDSYIIGDFKTNKDLYKNYKEKKMLGAFSDLLDCPFNHYQIQLSFYQILFEQMGLKVSSRKIFWLKPDSTFEVINTTDYTSILKEELKTKKLW
ncbi:MAG: hypothetical protein ACRC0V_09710 [Fusobacteriaceae bacterium]